MLVLLSAVFAPAKVNALHSTRRVLGPFFRVSAGTGNAIRGRAHSTFCDGAQVVGASTTLNCRGRRSSVRSRPTTRSSTPGADAQELQTCALAKQKRSGRQPPPNIRPRHPCVSISLLPVILSCLKSRRRQWEDGFYSRAASATCHPEKILRSEAAFMATISPDGSLC